MYAIEISGYGTYLICIILFFALNFYIASGYLQLFD